jgi:hypothetical protein
VAQGVQTSCGAHPTVMEASRMRSRLRWILVGIVTALCTVTAQQKSPGPRSRSHQAHNHAAATVVMATITGESADTPTG